MMILTTWTKTIYKRLLIILGLLIWPSVLFASNLKPFTATYVVTLHGLHIGKITRSLDIRDGHYQFISDLKSTIPFASLEINAVSTGEWTKNGPKPTDYHFQYRHFKKTKTISTHFDWQKMIATTNKHGKIEIVHIPTDAQDKLSYQLTMRADLLNNKKNLSYHVADGHSLDVYQFDKIGHEVVSTPAGKLNSIKMQRINTGPDSEDIIFWLTPQNNYAIAKIIDIEGDKIHMAGLLKNYQFK